MPFYLPEDSAKVFSGWSNDFVMCANKKLPSAISTCCGGYADREPSISEAWADVMCEYREERLTFAGNQQRCTDWGRSVCDPERIGPFTGWKGQCLHHQCCRDVKSTGSWMHANRYHWSTQSCDILVKVMPSDGTVGIVHDPANPNNIKTWGSANAPRVANHVNKDKLVSYFYVQWKTTDQVGKLDFPHGSENACDGGTIETDGSCLCTTNIVGDRVFSSLPTREQVLSTLHIGAFDPSMFDNGVYSAVVESNAADGVSVFKRTSGIDYDIDTIFKVQDQYNVAVFLKNVQSIVKVCDGAYSFRNSPTFYDLVNPELISAYQEMEAYLSHVHNHSNTPPFVCKALLRHFGFSNPSPLHVFTCSTAFKSGVFSWTNPYNTSETILYGSGERGDLKAVAASILMHDDSISPTLDADPTSGGVKGALC